MVFLSQKVDGNMIFTWYFWVFYDIPGPGKYGFPRSEIFKNHSSFHKKFGHSVLIY